MSRFSRLQGLRPSPAAVIGVVALVFALSGVAVALPGKGSVTAKDIKKGAVTTKALKNGAVTGAKLGDGSVTTAKLAANAATGAKVDEATLGKVPSAISADTAAKATTAESAGKATEAENAKELEGRTLAQVRPIANGIKDESTQGLDDLTYEPVMGANVTLPTGGADVVINASIELNNGSGGQAGGACRLKFSESVVSSAVNVTMATGHSASVSLTAFVNGSGAGTRQALVECLGSIADNDVDFINGDLAVQAFPVGS